MDPWPCHRNMKSMLYSPLCSGSPSLHQSIGHSRIDIHIWMRHLLYIISIHYNYWHSGQRSLYYISSNCTHITKYVCKVHLKQENKEEWKTIIKHTYHYTTNCALTQDYNKLTSHCLSQYSQHHTWMSTYHQLSKANSEATHNLRITTMASSPSTHLSCCPTISHWWIYKWPLNVHPMHRGQAHTEDDQSQDQVHYKAIWTHTFGRVWYIPHSYFPWPILLYSIHPWLHTIYLDFRAPRLEVNNMHLSLLIISGPSWLNVIWSKTNSVQ